MKIDAGKLAAMREAIDPLDTPERREKYRTGQFRHADRVKDLDKRYRWDLLYDSGVFDVVDLYDYMDAHIDTALRYLVPPL